MPIKSEHGSVFKLNIKTFLLLQIFLKHICILLVLLLMLDVDYLYTLYKPLCFRYVQIN